MKIGIFGINIGRDEKSTDRLLSVAVKAEEVGAESAWTGEHVMIPLDYASRYPFDPSGRLPAAPESVWIDPFIALAQVAAVTKRLRLGTGVNLLAQTNPLLFAKQTASLDYVSGGRLLLGLGVGWLEEEFNAMGVPFARRGARMDDYVLAIKKVWSGEVVEHQSEFLNWSGFKSWPTPRSSPHPPIIIGGHSPAALRRTARYGDGWFVFASKIDELRALLAKLRSAAEREGREFSQIEITALWDYGQGGATPIDEYRELGISRLLVFQRMLGKDPLAGLDVLGDTVLAKL